MTNSDAISSARNATSQMLAARLLVGLFQGIILYGLSFELGHDPVHTAMLAVFGIVPFAFNAGLTTLRSRTLAIHAAFLAILLGALRYHVAATQIDVVTNNYAISDLFSLRYQASIHGACAFAFVMQALVMASDGERRLFASYPSYFDAAWKLAVQLVLALFFTGAFWLLMFLGAGLFKLLGLGFFLAVIAHPAFASISTCLVIASAIHVTDVKPSIIRGIRTLKLTLFSWLLPIATIIAIGFVIALIIVGLATLKVGTFTGYIFIGMGFVLVYLINAAYQDGEVEQARSPVLRYAGSAASILVPVFAALALYRLNIRIVSDGLSVDRVFGLGAIAELSCYGFGYAFAVFGRPGWLKRLEATNVVAALLFLSLYILLFTPIADPARLTAHNQIARLHKGKVSVAKFDFHYLTTQLGSYGVAADDRLKQDHNNEIATAANAPTGNALLDWSRPVTADEEKSHFTVYPAGQIIEPGFWQQDWNTQSLAMYKQCARGQAKCDAYLIDIENKGRPDIILSNGPYGSMNVFSENGDAKWRLIGSLNLPACMNDPFRQLLRDGKYALAQPSQISGLEVGGHRLSFVEPFDPAACPK